MELKVIENESREPDVKIVPSVKGGSFIIEATYGRRTFNFLVDEITLDMHAPWNQETSALRSGNSYLVRQYVRPDHEEPGRYYLGVVGGKAEISHTDEEGNNSVVSKIEGIHSFREVAPYPRRLK